MDDKKKDNDCQFESWEIPKATDPDFCIPDEIAKDLKLNSTDDVCDQFVIYSMATGERFDPVPRII